MKKHPIEQIHSSVYDKVVKSITLFFMVLSLLITIGLDIIYGVVNFHSNENDYIAQNATIGYISDNLINMPIKDVYFRDLDCDSSEEVQQLFPYGDQRIKRWYSQLICVTRFHNIRLSTSCSTTEYNCGPYCISTSEGSQCPISKLTIIENAVVDEDADQNLESNRDLYIRRDNSSYGIFKIQVVIRGYPCLNPLVYITAGLTNDTEYVDPENCDGTDYDTDNSVKIEQTTLSAFAKQGLEELGFNGVPTQAINSAITYLTARNKIESLAEDRCTQIDNQMISDTENCASSIEEIGFIYVVIKEIFTGAIGLIIIIEIIMLKCRIVNDIRIVTVILKIFLVCQMSFILIEGGLILYQEQLRRDAQQYFWGIAGCYTSEQVQNAFANFPNLFSSDENIYVSLERISIIVIGICEFILSMMFIVQMFHWCFQEKKLAKRAIYEQEKLTETQPQQLQPYGINSYPQPSDIKRSQNMDQQHSDTNPYQQPLSPIASNFQPGYNAQPKLAESYIPPQVDAVTQVVLGKKNSKY